MKRKTILKTPRILVRQRVRKALQYRAGIQAAITQGKLAELAGSDTRTVRLCIRDLIAQGVPIASSCEPPYGYFIVATPKEANDYQERLKSQLIEHNTRIKDFQRAAANHLKKAAQGRLI